MTDPMYMALIAALPPTIAALAAMTVSIINSIKANRIHVLVNSNMTAVKSDLAAANQKIQELQSLISKILTPTPPPIIQIPVPPVPVILNVPPTA